MNQRFALQNAAVFGIERVDKGFHKQLSSSLSYYLQESFRQRDFLWVREIECRPVLKFRCASVAPSGRETPKAVLWYCCKT